MEPDVRNILNQVTDKIDYYRISDSRWLLVLIYALCSVVFVLAWLQTGISEISLSGYEWFVAITAMIFAIFLFSVSLFELVTYFVFIPSIKSDAHIFTRVHANQLIHPLTTSVVLSGLVACVIGQSALAWGVWSIVCLGYALQTGSIVKHIRKDQSGDPSEAPPQNLLSLLAYLILGAEIVTMAAGAKAIAPWKIKFLPGDTWIVDVRTKPEFQWNRLRGAQNFPWGLGLVESAKSVPKGRTVLVTCLSGHRSPSVAVMLRKLGFQNVYNLNWGLLYLILLERGKTGSGVFDLTRTNSNTSERGRDYKGISYGYIVSAMILLVLAPFENSLSDRSVLGIQKFFGGLLGLGGLFTAWLAFRSLGRNFRVFAAPRRSGKLIQSGIYSKVRHPMYTSVIVGFAGYVLYWGSYWGIPFWFSLTALYIVKALKEEGVLIQRFPEYQEYKSRTWRFLPYIF